MTSVETNSLLVSPFVCISSVKSKCLPCLLYGIDVVPMHTNELKSIDFPAIKVLMNNFRTSSTSNIREYQFYFNFPSVETCVMLRATKFLRKYSTWVNVLCMWKICATCVASVVFLFHSLFVCCVFDCLPCFGGIKMYITKCFPPNFFHCMCSMFTTAPPIEPVSELRNV